MEGRVEAIGEFGLVMPIHKSDQYNFQCLEMIAVHISKHWKFHQKFSFTLRGGDTGGRQ